MLRGVGRIFSQIQVSNGNYSKNLKKTRFLFQSQISNHNPFLGEQDTDSKITPPYCTVYHLPCLHLSCLPSVLFTDCPQCPDYPGSGKSTTKTVCPLSCLPSFMSHICCLVYCRCSIPSALSAVCYVYCLSFLPSFMFTFCPVYILSCLHSILLTVLFTVCPVHNLSCLSSVQSTICPVYYLYCQLSVQIDSCSPEFGFGK